jgi:endonuclease YncB( thermonuclease family)
VRLAGIDSPEIKSKNEIERNAAIKSRDALAGLVLNKWVSFKNVKREKFGRVLADIYVKNPTNELEEIHVNQWMLNNYLAVSYNGKKKAPFMEPN